MIVTVSSSSFFALAKGCPVIIPRFKNRIDLNPLSYISDIPFYVYSAQQLREICDKIVTSQEPTIPIEKYHKFLDNYLCFPKHNEEYLKKIEGLRKTA